MKIIGPENLSISVFLAFAVMNGAFDVHRVIIIPGIRHCFSSWSFCAKG
jgi:hypothetical protein